MDQTKTPEPAKAADAASPPVRWPVVEWIGRRPRVRKFLETHDLHILPHRVEHSRRARRAVLATGVALLLFAAWWWVIPRTDVTLEAQYHEGLFNKIAVDMRIDNGGTLTLAPLQVRLVVTDLTQNASVGFLILNTTLAPHRTLNLNALEFKGDQVETSYLISILVTFNTPSGRVTKSFDFRTEEPFMNLYFSGRVA